jgi:hypothetical protein
LEKRKSKHNLSQQKLTVGVPKDGYNYIMLTSILDNLNYYLDLLKALMAVTWRKYQLQKNNPFIFKKRDELHAPHS